MTEDRIHQFQVKEAEEAVVGSILIDSGAFSKVGAILLPDMFYNPFCKSVYRAAKRLHGKSKKIDLITVTQEIKRESNNQDPELFLKISELASNIGNTEGILEHSLSIIEYHVNRNLWLQRGILNNINPASDCFDNLNKIEKMVHKLRHDAIGGFVEPISATADKAFEEIEKRRDGTYLGSIIESPFPDLNKHILGGFTEGLTYIVGRPGMGKSTAMVAILYQAAIVLKKKCLFLCLDMSKKKFVNWMLSYMSGINHDRFVDIKKAKELTPDEINKLFQAKEELKKSKLTIHDKNLSATEFNAMVEAGKYEMACGDHLGLMKEKGGKGERVRTNSNNLKDGANQNLIPYVFLAQLKRPDNKNTTRPELTDIAWAGEAEQDAQTVIGLYREHYYTPGSLGINGESLENTIEMILLKNREGKKDITVELYCDLGKCTIRTKENIDKEIRINNEGEQYDIPF